MFPDILNEDHLVDALENHQTLVVSGFELYIPKIQGTRRGKKGETNLFNKTE